MKSADAAGADAAGVSPGATLGAGVGDAEPPQAATPMASAPSRPRLRRLKLIEFLLFPRAGSSSAPISSSLVAAVVAHGAERARACHDGPQDCRAL